MCDQVIPQRPEYLAASAGYTTLGPMNLNQVTLPAINVAESVDFYKRMGFELIVDAPHYARFKCPNGSASFSVHKVGGVSDSSDVVVYFEDEALDQTVQDL